MNAIAPSAPATIPLATDGDFLKAEAELERLMDLHDQANDDAAGDALAAQWQPIRSALLGAELRTPLQAAVALRRLVCQRTGIKRGAPEDYHEGMINRVIGLLETSERPPSTGDAGFYAVLDMEAPIREIRAVGETLYALSTCRAFPEYDGMRLVCDMLSTQVIDKAGAIKAQFDAAITALRPHQQREG